MFSMYRFPPMTGERRMHVMAWASVLDVPFSFMLRGGGTRKERGLFALSCIAVRDEQVDIEKRSDDMKGSEAVPHWPI